MRFALIAAALVLALAAWLLHERFDYHLTREPLAAGRVDAYLAACRAAGDFSENRCRCLAQALVEQDDDRLARYFIATYRNLAPAEEARLWGETPADRRRLLYAWEQAGHRALFACGPDPGAVPVPRPPPAGSR